VGDRRMENGWMKILRSLDVKSILRFAHISQQKAKINAKLSVSNIFCKKQIRKNFNIKLISGIYLEKHFALSFNF
jgi:hypothetical protein